MADRITPFEDSEVVTTAVFNQRVAQANAALDEIDDPESGAIPEMQQDIEELKTAKPSKSITAPVTLTAAGWVEDAANGWWTQAVNVAGVTATSPNEILPALDITEEQLMEFQAANVQDGGQAAGQITLKAWNFAPSIDIPVRVIVRGDL